ncbi:hypothetical protein BH09PAT3_BH09PAT3_2520 [soil metagenome]
MSRTPTSGWRRALASIPFLVIIGLALVWWQRQYLYDQVRLYGYKPDAAVVQLADDSAMSDYARRIYYVNHPLRAPKASFVSYCSNAAEQTVVLGCYKSGQRGIYLLQVTNAELAGIQQVTAAHEMLHAAYDRLSDKDRTRIDGLLQDYYQNQLSDDTIKKTVDAYKKTEPDDLKNEMHSIFATQVATLPTELSDYYKKYFTDRSKVTGFYATYEQAFTSRQQQIKQYDEQLNTQKFEIDNLQSSVEQQQSDLKAKRDVLNSSRASNNVAAYNTGVDDFNATVRTYNANVARLKTLISDYNELIEKRNSIAFEERQLVQSLSSPSAITE